MTTTIMMIKRSRWKPGRWMTLTQDLWISNFCFCHLKRRDQLYHMRRGSQDHKGWKYSKVGNLSNRSGFGGVKGGLAAIPCRTANNSLARNTWRFYYKLEIETGTRLRAPMSETMILTVLAILLRRGLKTCTMKATSVSCK